MKYILIKETYNDAKQTKALLKRLIPITFTEDKCFNLSQVLLRVRFAKDNIKDDSKLRQTYK